MYLVKKQTSINPADKGENYTDICNLRQAGNVLKPEQIKAGGYYIYKEKHGMVSLVKVIRVIVKDDWIGFHLMVKRVLYSPWDIPKGRIFEVGLNLTVSTTSWHFEPGMLLVKSEPKPI